MSNEIIINTEIPHDELVYLYQQSQANLKKEYDKNVFLKSENKRLLECLETKKRRISEITQSLKIVANL